MKSTQKADSDSAYILVFVENALTPDIRIVGFFDFTMNEEQIDLKPENYVGSLRKQKKKNKKNMLLKQRKKRNILKKK